MLWHNSLSNANAKRPNESGVEIAKMPDTMEFKAEKTASAAKKEKKAKGSGTGWSLGTKVLVGAGIALALYAGYHRYTRHNPADSRPAIVSVSNAHTGALPPAMEAKRSPAPAAAVKVDAAAQAKIKALGEELDKLTFTTKDHEYLRFDTDGNGKVIGGSSKQYTSAQPSEILRATMTADSVNYRWKAPSGREGGATLKKNADGKWSLTVPWMGKNMIYDATPHDRPQSTK